MKLVDRRGFSKTGKPGGSGNEVPAANCPQKKQPGSARRSYGDDARGLAGAPRIVAGNRRSDPLAWAVTGGGIRHGGPAMKTVPWNTAIEALVLVRLGQELGTESQFARAIHDLVAAVLAFGT